MWHPLFKGFGREVSGGSRSRATGLSCIFQWLLKQKSARFNFFKAQGLGGKGMIDSPAVGISRSDWGGEH